MRSCWDALRSSVVRKVRSTQAEDEFAKVKEGQVALAPFASLADVAALLAGPSCLDEKDAVYAALVRIVQGRGAGAALASALLWFGLWPGLNAIFSRRVCGFPDGPAALVSEISWQFTNLIERLDFGAVRRFAATLVHSTERGLLEQRERLSRAAATEQELDEEELAAPAPEAPGLSRDFALPGDGGVETLRAWLVGIAGVDADLIIGSVVQGVRLRALGQERGASHEAARKRLQRALARVREHLQQQSQRKECPR